MPASIQMNIVWVSNEHGAGPAPVASPEKPLNTPEKQFLCKRPEPLIRAALGKLSSMD
jgi:hypothetical protein